MRKLLFCASLLISLLSFSQGGYEYYLIEGDVDEFDVFGEQDYETNLSIEGNLNQKLKIEVGSEIFSAEVNGANFIAKNTLDANMQTCWLTPDNGKNALIEFVIDFEEMDINSATLNQIAFFNGWRKDYQTWNDYARVKKVSLTINDKPYAEITLENTYKYQKIDLDKMKLDKTRRYRFRFRIMEMYPGKKYQQTAISDIQFIGRAK